MEVKIAKMEDMEKIYRLTYDMYFLNKYCKPRSDGMLQHYPHLDGINETTTFIIVEDDELLGTVSYTFDNPLGLHVDQDFPTEMVKLRKYCERHDKTLAAGWRIVTKFSSVNTVAVLINAAMTLALDSKTDVFVADFNPKHEKFYHRILGLETIAVAEECCSVNNAPGVLMVGNVPDILKKWYKFYNRIEERNE